MMIETSTEAISHILSLAWQLYGQSGWLMILLVLLALIIYCRCFQLFYLFFKQVSLKEYTQAIQVNDFVELDSYVQHWFSESEAKLRSLFILISICPLLGLLGTVVGMIDTFSVLANTVVNNNGISHGISVALNTTQAGLVIAVPALFFLALLKQKKEKMMQQIACANKVNTIKKLEAFTHV